MLKLLSSIHEKTDSVLMFQQKNYGHPHEKMGHHLRYLNKLKLVELLLRYLDKLNLIESLILGANFCNFV